MESRGGRVAVALVAVLAGLLTWAVVPDAHRRAAHEVSVLVLNASGIPLAGAVAANTLRGYDFRIAGLVDDQPLPDEHLSKRMATTVQCRPGYEQERAVIAKIVGGRQESAFALAPDFVADCVVTRGRG